MAKLTIKTRYATIPNDLLTRSDISLKAKGLFAYLQSKPDNWSFSKERIAKELREGVDSIKGAYAELKKAGYLQTKPVKTAEGKFGCWEYILLDNPSSGKTVGRKTHPTENPTDISKQDNKKQEYIKQELYNSENKFSQEIAQVIQLFKDSLSPSLAYGNKTQRNACEEMLNRFGIDATIAMTQKVISVQGQKFAPVVTTPHQMWQKLGQLRIYFDSENQSTVLDLTKSL